MVKYVITSPLSLARIMWWYGEDELWPAALELSPAEVADLAPRFAELLATPERIEILWPGAPTADAHLVLGTIEHFEGVPRPAARRHRRGGPMPEPLERPEEERWGDPALVEVLRLVDEGAGLPASPTPPWPRRPLHGRWAPGWPSAAERSRSEEARHAKIRAAVVGDASAMGRVMVESWLAAHRDQMPDAVWQKRVEEWTPDVSARAWARLFTERAESDHDQVVLLVAEDDAGELVGLVLGTAAEGETTGSTAEIGALYVLPDHQGKAIGRRLLRAAGSELATLGFSKLQVGVLTANLPARRFYEAMSGQEIGQRTFDEEGVLLPETVYAWSDLTTLNVD